MERYDKLVRNQIPKIIELDGKEDKIKKMNIKSL